MTRVAEGRGPAFGDRLTEHVRRRESQIVLGLDPDPARLWPRAVAQAGGVDGSAPPAARAARAVAAHCAMVIEAAGEHCVAVKPQVACFERLGAPGWDALAATVEAAQAAGLLVIADAKRGDIDVSAGAYAQAFFTGMQTPYGRVTGLGADALTVNPYLGRDSLEPFLAAAREVAGGLFVLARTSNPGAADLQERELRDGTGDVAACVGALVDELGSSGVGSAGLSDVGAVVGATAPHRLAQLRAAMPHAPFLLPGVGRQGGRIEDMEAVFAVGVAGGLPSLSRSLVDAHRDSGSDPAGAAAAEAARVRALAWDVAAAAG
ncbi:MAG TPA: orotidine-5'-phosphate decarboxylase [Solirubrobacteraceae bacterium]|nr:orotidine-5'-phosphate decarboxylase [Solirubrobacteraceae bacterium]